MNQEKGIIANSIVMFLESRYEEMDKKSCDFVSNNITNQNGSAIENTKFFLIRKDIESNTCIIAVYSTSSKLSTFSVNLHIIISKTKNNVVIEFKDITKAIYPIYINKNIESNSRIVNLLDNIEDMHNITIVFLKGISYPSFITKKEEITLTSYFNQHGQVFFRFLYKKRVVSVSFENFGVRKEVLLDMNCIHKINNYLNTGTLYDYLNEVVENGSVRII